MSRATSKKSAHTEPGRTFAGVLAILVHVLFFAFLVVGLNWKAEPPEGMAVDLWGSLPPPVALPQAPKPKPVERPTPPAPPEEPTPAEPPRKAEPLPQPKPDIALKDKNEKKRPVEKKPKIDKEKELQEKIEREEKEQREREQKEKEQKEKERKEREQREKEQKEKEQKEKERKEKEQREKERREKEQKARILAEVEQLRREQEASDKRQAEAIAAQARVANEIAEYKAKILAKIRRNITMPPDIMDNPVVEFDVTLLPGGDILDVRLRASSGIPAFDSAVERGITLAQPLPLPPDPAMFAKFRNLNVKVHYRE